MTATLAVPVVSAWDFSPVVAAWDFSPDVAQTPAFGVCGSVADRAVRRELPGTRRDVRPRARGSAAAGAGHRDGDRGAVARDRHRLPGLGDDQGARGIGDRALATWRATRARRASVSWRGSSHDADAARRCTRTGPVLFQTAGGADQRQHVATLEAAGRRLLAIVNDALDLAKIDAGHLAFRFRPFDPPRR